LSTGKFNQTLHVFLRAAALIFLVCASAPQTLSHQASRGSESGISVEWSPQIFATMCALDAAGYGADESTLAELPARLALRADLLKMQGPAVEALRQFYRDHQRANPGETLSRYITFALVVGPPPRFEYGVDRELLPPDVLTIEGFNELLANFYQEAHLAARWARVEPEYNRTIARYQGPVARIVMISNGYLREILKPSSQRSFTVYVEPLVGNRTNFRSTGDQYAIVVGTGPEVPVDEIQHAYLHFMLDSLPLQYRTNVESKAALLNIAARAPQLPVEYRNDFLSFTDECLIKAVELRLRRLSPEQFEEAMANADRSGFILVRPLVAQLQKFEKSEPAMSYYFPDLISGIDVQAEQKRLQGISFAMEEPARAAKQEGASSDKQPSELDVWLAAGDRQLALRDAPAAAATFQRVLQKYPGQPRAVYGLAIASVLVGEADRARELFERLVAGPAPLAPGSAESSEPADPTILAWSHVYLGRIHDLEDEREMAVMEYRAALAVNGAPEAARVAAQRGVEVPYKAPAQGNGNEEKKP
jgi:tetratricopeptide (TPR) repeat protein